MHDIHFYCFYFYISFTQLTALNVVNLNQDIAFIHLSLVFRSQLFIVLPQRNYLFTPIFGIFFTPKLDYITLFNPTSEPSKRNDRNQQWEKPRKIRISRRNCNINCKIRAKNNQ